MLLGDVEAEFKLRNKEVPEEHTVFHGRLIDFEERPVDDLLENEGLEFRFIS